MSATRGHPSNDRCDPAMVAALRTQTATERLTTLDGLWRSARAFVLAGVRAQHPDWSEEQVVGEVARRMSRLDGGAR
jgi:hypothetical protein